VSPSIDFNWRPRSRSKVLYQPPADLGARQCPRAFRVAPVLRRHGLNDADCAFHRPSFAPRRAERRHYDMGWLDPTPPCLIAGNWLVADLLDTPYTAGRMEPICGLSRSDIPR
jgi:hypothetical protein